ncbi:MAG: HisA/HisF-related TIM barrel protein, partial [Hyphomicrobium sp.]
YICGSEMFLTTGFCQTEDIKETLWNAGILSLDFRGDTFLGPPFLLKEISLWPETIIVMCLERVGCNRGPDLKKIEWVLQQAGSLKKIYAAGSIRNSEDLFSLKKSGVAGALIATALHDGQIKVGDLFKIAD